MSSSLSISWVGFGPIGYPTLGVLVLPSLHCYAPLIYLFFTQLPRLSPYDDANCHRPWDSLAVMRLRSTTITEDQQRCYLVAAPYPFFHYTTLPFQTPSTTAIFTVLSTITCRFKSLFFDRLP